MGLISLKTDLRQELQLTPQLLQSMEVLQMNAQELLEYLNRVTEENPVLEQEDSADLRHSYEELRQKASWLDGGVYGATSTHEEGVYPCLLSTSPSPREEHLYRIPYSACTKKYKNSQT